MLFPRHVSEHMDCPKTECHSLEATSFALPMVMRDALVVQHQLEDEDGLELVVGQVPRTMLHQLLLDQFLQTV